jgi:pyruvoyl-dependent arginine decarboxylase (PvlArgDC)
MAFVVEENPVPLRYFWTWGVGEDELTHHAGSDDAAYEDANVENINHVFYSSLIPPIATEIPRPVREVDGVVTAGKYRIRFGTECKSIVAISRGGYHDRITSGLALGWVYDRNDERYGGLVAEYPGTEHKGKDSVEEARGILVDNIHGMFKRRFKDRAGFKLDVDSIKVQTASIEPKKKFGTAYVGIIFVDYIRKITDEMKKEDVDALYKNLPKLVRKLDAGIPVGKDKADTGQGQA